MSEKVYFKKELVNNQVYFKGGIPVPFQHVADDEGILETDDKGKIEQLEAFIARRMGGVSKISLADYEALKKNAPSSKLDELSQKPPARLFQPNANPYQQEGQQKSVPSAKVPGSAPSAEGLKTAGSAKDPDASQLKTPRKPFAPRTSKAK